MYDELKKIEDELEGEEYFSGGLGYYFICDTVPITWKNAETIKETLVKSGEIREDVKVELVKIEDPVSDFETISDEWRFSEDIKERFLDILKEADGYYSYIPDGAYGCVWTIHRLLQKGDELVMLEFYVSD